VSVVTETKPVSKGMADAFGAAFAAAGGEVVSTQVVPDGTADFAGPVAEVVPLRPDLVFYGGEYVHGAEFSAQAKAAGVTAPVMGSDGLKDHAYISGVGPASKGDLASSIGAPAASIPSARRFLDAYSDAGYADPPSDFGVYAYDAANVIIAAAKVALDGLDRVTADALESVVAGIQGTDTAGASGALAFDEFGDTRSKVLTVYRVAGGRWTPVKVETLH
jgi:branched-chain amino acid transport system substrate-binding protein